MAATTIKSTMTPASNQTGQTVAVRQFKITDIPDAMKKIEWPVAAELMLKWFDGKPWSTTKDGGNRVSAINNSGNKMAGIHTAHLK